MNSISQQNPVRVFVAHAFASNDDYRRIFEYLEGSKNFFYRNCSATEVSPTLDKEGLRQELRRQIGLSEVVLVAAGQYHEHKDWIEFQINCAKGFDKPVIVLVAFGVTEKLPVLLEALASEVIEWNDRVMVDAIKRQARHEESTRWDVIEFKLD